jgi:hypothetical protein
MIQRGDPGANSQSYEKGIPFLFGKTERFEKMRKKFDLKVAALYDQKSRCS